VIFLKLDTFLLMVVLFSFVAFLNTVSNSVYTYYFIFSLCLYLLTTFAQCVKQVRDKELLELEQYEKIKQVIKQDHLSHPQMKQIREQDQ
jgi:predicted membrane protein